MLKSRKTEKKVCLIYNLCVTLQYKTCRGNEEKRLFYLGRHNE